MDLPGAILDEEKHVEPAKEHQVSTVKWPSQEGGRLGSEELTQVGPDLIGEGSMPWRFKMAQTLDGASRMPMASSSPWIRR